MTTIKVLVESIKPFSLEGALHGNAPMFGCHQVRISGTSNGADNAEAVGVEGIDGGNSNGSGGGEGRG
jgi:hypothetical protein